MTTPLDHSPKWKPLAAKTLVLDKLVADEERHFYQHMNRMRYEADPLTYQPTATCREASPYKEHHAIRLPDIGGDFIFTIFDKSSVSADDLAQNPELQGTIKFIKFLRDGS